jgi:hypothetical protein
MASINDAESWKFQQQASLQISDVTRSILWMFHNDKLKTIYDYHLAEYYTARSDEIFQETKDILSKVESYTHREALDIIKQRFYETKYKF